jgi:rubredoxin
MTEPVQLTLAIPDLDTAPDEVIESLLRTRDGRWSWQTKAMLAKAGVTRLTLNDAWASTPMSWVCPCCQRDKPSIARLTPSGVLLCQLDYHHDHLQDRAKAIFRQNNPLPEDVVDRRQLVQAMDSCRGLIERFATALVCNDCNAAEGAAKLALKPGVHADFSFSPSEIARFITAKPGQSHQVDAEHALQIWHEAQPVFQDLLDFAAVLSKRVAEGRHRKEGGPSRSYVRAPSDPEIIHHLLVAQACDRYRPWRLAGQLDARSRSAAGAGSSIRPKRRSGGKAPTAEAFADLDARQQIYGPWRNAPVDWRCAVCERGKAEICRKSNAGRWSGSIHEIYEHEVETDAESLSYRLAERGRPIIGGHHPALVCHDCRNVIAECKRRSPGLTDASLTLEDLRAVITAVEPHGRHEVDFAAAVERAAANGDWAAAVEDHWRHRSRAQGLFHQATHLHKRLGWSVEDVEWTLAVEQNSDAHEDPDRALDHIRWLINQGAAFDKAGAENPSNL